MTHAPPRDARARCTGDAPRTGGSCRGRRSTRRPACSRCGAWRGARSGAGRVCRSTASRSSRRTKTGLIRDRVVATPSLSRRKPTFSSRFRHSSVRPATRRKLAALRYSLRDSRTYAFLMAAVWFFGCVKSRLGVSRRARRYRKKSASASSFFSLNSDASKEHFFSAMRKRAASNGLFEYLKPFYTSLAPPCTTIASFSAMRVQSDLL